jgi:hypothetical protein
VRDIRSLSRLPPVFIFEPSHHFLAKLSTRIGIKSFSSFFRRSQCDPKSEGDVRDIKSPSRVSNDLYIRLWRG